MLAFTGLRELLIFRISFVAAFSHQNSLIRHCPHIGRYSCT
jgi:hypothetical protein